MSDPAVIKDAIKQLAGELGFVCARIAAAGPTPGFDRYRRWIDAGAHGSMAYCARHLDVRADLRAQHPWASSVASLALSYAPEPSAPPSRIARYARGRDYHKTLKQRAHALCDRLVERVGPMRTRVCVDTAPVGERAWAIASGLGFLGANGCVINPARGSYLLLAEILLAPALAPDEPLSAGCDGCGRCRRACPNGAIDVGGVVDARRCISYLTIEHRGAIDADRLRLAGQLFGCDRCQQVCPYNQPGRCPPGDVELRGPRPIAAVEPIDVLRWRWDDWDRLTRGTVGRRAGLPQWRRNAAIVAGQERLTACRDALATLARSDQQPEARAAAWAMSRL